MKPIRFLEANVVWAENQPDYLPLPAYSDSEKTVTCWELTFEEVETIIRTRKLWFSTPNFGRPLQPQLPSVESPFENTSR